MSAFVTSVRLPIALFLLVGAGCAGTLVDPEAFAVAGGDQGAADAGEVTTPTGSTSCPDVPTMLAQSCGTSGCHDAITKAEALDLASPGVVSRLLGVPAVEGSGLLIDPTTPSQSIVYEKLLATPPFGARMPTTTGLDDASIQCVLDWVTAQASAGGGDSSGDAGTTPLADAGSAAGLDAGPPFSPLRVAAGQTAPVTDSEGNTWSADTGFTDGTAAVQMPNVTITGTSDSALYNGQRYGDPSFSYQFTVPNGTYTVTLKFAEQYVTGPAMREFDIAINGAAVETNFDIYATAGAMNAAVDRNYTVVASGGSIQLAFTPGTIQSPKVDAIQIVAGASVDGGT